MDAKERAAELGNRLRDVRKKNGDSLRDVEERSGLKNGYLSQLENGKIISPSPSVLQKAADGYGLRFADLLKWAGYVDESEPSPGTNQAVAFNSVAGLGEPSDEELQALKAIVDVLQKNRNAGFSVPSADRPLDPEELRLIRGYATALLREADAIGARPTPLEDIQAAARLVMTEEITLDPRDRARLTERFGHWVNRAWRRLQGAFDFRTQEIWVKPELHPRKKRFVVAHEIGHAILPAHRESFAYIDDASRLPPVARELFEREANQVAIEILMQGGQAAEEFDDSAPGLALITRIADDFGASIVATARYVVENSRRPLGLAIAHTGAAGRFGPPHVYASRRFEESFGWCGGSVPWGLLNPAIATAAREEKESWLLPDRSSQGHVLQVEKMHTGWAALVLVRAESRVQKMGRLLTPGGAAVATALEG